MKKHGTGGITDDGMGGVFRVCIHFKEICKGAICRELLGGLVGVHSFSKMCLVNTNTVQNDRTTGHMTTTTGLQDTRLQAQTTNWFIVCKNMTVRKGCVK